MITPLQFMKQYRNLVVEYALEDEQAAMSRIAKASAIKVRKYFMMSWNESSEERKDFDRVTRGGRHNDWYIRHKQFILNAAMGKGSPRDYQLALEWAVRSGKIETPDPISIQQYCDAHLGIDCSGFVTNYLVAAGKSAYSDKLVRNTNAASYFKPGRAINDVGEVRRGDLLVWMNGNAVRRRPGHIAIVEAFAQSSRAEGNIHVVEATGSTRANPKLVDSKYHVEEIIDRGHRGAPVMMLKVRRFGRSGGRVAVIRP